MERIITCLNNSYGLDYCVPKIRTQEAKAQAVNQRSNQIKEKVQMYSMKYQYKRNRSIKTSRYEAWISFPHCPFLLSLSGHFQERFVVCLRIQFSSNLVRKLHIQIATLCMGSLSITKVENETRGEVNSLPEEGVLILFYSGLEENSITHCSITFCGASGVNLGQ